MSCDAGEVFDGDSLLCVPCPRGTHHNDTECVPCEVGTYASEQGMTKCVRCTTGFADQVGMSSCSECPENTARPGGSPGISALECECTFGHYALLGPGQACTVCFAGADCAGGTQPPIPQPGFWGNAQCRGLGGDLECENWNTFLECNPEDFCLGSFECKKGHKGRLCREVEEGYFGVGGLWHRECGDTGYVVSILGIIGVVLIWIVLVRLHFVPLSWLAVAGGVSYER